MLTSFDPALNTHSPAVKPRSVALVHEWFGATGGSEQVFLHLADALPQARRFVLWRDDDAGGGADEITESWLARTFLRHHKALALPVMPLAWRTLSRSTFDVVVSSSHAFAHTVKLGSPTETRYLSYVHAPARYLWSPELDVRGAPPALAPLRAALKASDVRLSRHVHSYAANSEEVRRRIERCWRREARVIHPPVDVAYFAEPAGRAPLAGRDYLLGVGRWIGYKRFDLMIDIAERAGVPLVIAGSGPAEDALRRQAAAATVSVRFEVRPDRQRLRELYRSAKGLLFPTHEDFGIIPVEAQAAGTPVLGLDRGGLQETVVGGETGYLLDTLDPARYAELVPALEKLAPERITANARRFGVGSFHANVATWLAEDAGIESMATRC